MVRESGRKTNQNDRQWHLTFWWLIAIVSPSFGGNPCWTFTCKFWKEVGNLRRDLIVGGGGRVNEPWCLHEFIPVVENRNNYNAPLSIAASYFSSPAPDLWLCSAAFVRSTNHSLSDSNQRKSRFSAFNDARKISSTIQAVGPITLTLEQLPAVNHASFISMETNVSHFSHKF